MGSASAPEWILWRSFAAVVRAGSLTRAAGQLNLSQPTLGRHIDALERATGARLFERHLRGLKPTEKALKLFEQVEIAERAIARAEMMAEGADAELSGSVRLTASTVTAHYTLPKILKTLRTEFPAIAIELVPSDSPENLLMRESDIAVRMFRPTQLELITRKLGTSRIVCCAHQNYLAGRAIPQTPEDLTRHDLAGFDRSELLISAARSLGYDLRREHFALRTDSQTAMWELVKAGLGIGFGQEILAREVPGMVMLLPQMRIPPLEVWLTTHRELFTNRRIRVIYDRLGELLAAYYAQ